MMTLLLLMAMWVGAALPLLAGEPTAWKTSGLAGAAGDSPCWRAGMGLTRFTSGAMWAACNAGLPAARVSCLARDADHGHVFYAGVSCNGSKQ
jgi:hypothetical protein